jgi:hypothetical protein
LDVDRIARVLRSRDFIGGTGELFDRPRRAPRNEPANGGGDGDADQADDDQMR